MKKVEIYTTQSCHYCNMTKEFFKEHNIQYETYDVGQDIARRNEMVELSGQMGVPVTVIDRKDVVIGFNKPVLTKLLEIQ